MSVDLKAHSCSITVNSQVLKTGELCQEVLPEDCNWQMESLGDGHGKCIWITLVKKFKTKGNQHWKCIFRGDPEVDLTGFGPPVHAMDPGDMDRGELRRKMDEVQCEMLM